MMGTRNQIRPAAMFACFLAALALVAVFALPQQAMADELAASRLTAQSAYSNTSLANAMELPYGQTYSGTFDYTDDGYWEDYWFKFKTSNRNSEYVVRVDSVNGNRVDCYVYNESGNNDYGNWNRSGGGQD